MVRVVREQLNKFRLNKFSWFWIVLAVFLIAIFIFIYTRPAIPVCGDNSCNGQENSVSCFQDCGSVCGDGVCNGNETKCNCNKDCGNCAIDSSATGNICQQAVCNSAEQCIVSTKENCCGNNLAEVGETCSSCAIDVKCSSGQTCCNSKCSEIKWSCSDWSSCSKTGFQNRACKETTGCTTNAEKPAESQSCSYIPAIGEKLIVGSFEYYFTGLEQSEFVGDNYYLVKQANGIYYILGFTITNVGNKSDNIPISQILIVDSSNREYSYDYSATAYLDDWIGSYEQLNPGVSIRGRIAYDVPESLTGNLKIGNGDIYSPSYLSFRLVRN